MGIMMMSLVVGKVIITLIIDGLFQGKLSNLIIGILMKMNLSQAEADVIYQNVFRANRDVFQWIGFMLLFLVGYYAALSKTANYLKNIGDGIDNVLSNSKQPIELETELEPIAEKLNTMKMTLARKERMAQESEQRKNDLVVYLAHDLKTPLTSVIAYLSMLDEKPDMPPEERKKYIHIAHTKAIRLSELISEFFEITKFNLQNIRLEKETINLSLMLEQIMDEFYAVFADNNLTGNIYTEEDLMVEGDPDKLARVFDNLLRNAVAYSYRGTNIDVRAYGEGVAVVIVFSNQGEPIPKQKLQTVFEKFYRADNSRSSQTGGAGLGLSVAKEIVELHEGTIEAFSDIQSTRFVVRLKRLLPKGQRQSGGVILMEENKKKKRTAGDVIRMLIMIVALGVFCYSGYQLLSIYQEYKKGSDEYHALENKYIDEKGMFEEINTDAAEPTMKNPIDFAGLKAVNEDIIAWLKVGAIDISYPVTQGKDNDYYLHNTFENQPNIAGCIFMDHGCKKDFSDPNTIIYGHNMRNLSMFGKLKQFRDQAVFDSDAYFWVYTPEKIYKYEIFSCQEVGATSETYQLQFSDKKKFQEYIDSCFERSVLKRDIEVTSDDKIVTLSTCTGNSETRFLVQGKLIETYKAV